MKKLFFASATFVLSTFLMTSCSKEDLIEPIKIRDHQSHIQEQELFYATSNCISYPDTILYMGDSSHTAINNQIGLMGTYQAYPADVLSIDTATGQIDMSASKSGMRVEVWFTSYDSSVICSTKVMISGITYLNGIYSLSDSLRHQAKAVYQEDSTRTMPSGTFAADKGLPISSSLGHIHLDSVYQAQLLGSDHYEVFTISYALDDPSNLYPQQAELHIYYFENTTDIPELLLEEAGYERAENENIKKKESQKPRNRKVIIITR